MITLDFSKPLIKLDSFYQIWNELTELQKKELCPEYFNFLDVVLENKEVSENRKFEIDKLRIGCSIAYLHAYFNVCSDKSTRYGVVKYQILNNNKKIFGKTNTLKEAKSLIIKMYKENITNEDLHVIKIRKLIPKDSLFFIDTSYEHLKYISLNK